VNVTGDRLIIRGEKKDQQEVKEADVGLTLSDIQQER